MHTPMERRTASDSAAMRWPCTSASPAVGGYRPISMDSSVLFPAPFSPSSPNVVPASMASDRSLTATFCPTAAAAPCSRSWYSPDGALAGMPSCALRAAAASGGGLIWNAERSSLTPPPLPPPLPTSSSAFRLISSGAAIPLCGAGTTRLLPDRQHGTSRRHADGAAAGVESGTGNVFRTWCRITGCAAKKAGSGAVPSRAAAAAGHNAACTRRRSASTSASSPAR